MTKSGLHEFISQNKLGVLASISSEGIPQSALVGIAITAELEVIFDTVRTSRKYRNLTARPGCSFVIGWTGQQTVQYDGKARELYPPEIEPYQHFYFNTWPDGPARMAWPGIVYFAVRPTWVRYSNFNENPPQIVEFNEFAVFKP